MVLKGRNNLGQLSIRLPTWLLLLRLSTCIIGVNVVLVLILDVRFFVFFTLVLFELLSPYTVSLPICIVHVSHVFSSPNSSISIFKYPDHPRLISVSLSGICCLFQPLCPHFPTSPVYLIPSQTRFFLKLSSIPDSSACPVVLHLTIILPLEIRLTQLYRKVVSPPLVCLSLPFSFYCTYYSFRLLMLIRVCTFVAKYLDRCGV